MSRDYVHGYSSSENERLCDQAFALVDLLHCDTAYPGGHSVLEAGCGVGAQTVVLARNSPGAAITAIDISEESLNKAQRKCEAAGIDNVTFDVQDINGMQYDDESFDHVFVSFVLEHMSDPVKTLRELKRVLKEGGTLTVIEGDHGSAYFHPDSRAARQAISCQVQLQADSGGNAKIGRTLHPLLVQAGFKSPYVTPRMVYADDSKPMLMDAFTRRTFTAMVEGVRDKAVSAGLIDEDTFDQGVRDLYRTAEPGGTFNYTFFKGQVVK
jgi:ubiquinone/menaquinone biosynthesis C-methylase UbiE